MWQVLLSGASLFFVFFPYCCRALHLGRICEFFLFPYDWGCGDCIWHCTLLLFLSFFFFGGRQARFGAMVLLHSWFLQQHVIRCAYYSWASDITVAGLDFSFPPVGFGLRPPTASRFGLATGSLNCCRAIRGWLPRWIFFGDLNYSMSKVEGTGWIYDGASARVGIVAQKLILIPGDFWYGSESGQGVCVGSFYYELNKSSCPYA